MNKDFKVHFELCYRNDALICIETTDIDATQLSSAEIGNAGIQRKCFQEKPIHIKRAWRKGKGDGWFGCYFTPTDTEAY
jgi:hypothetical protein